MDRSSLNEEALADAGREEIVAALFQQLVMQQTNMALMFLGRIPHPETGDTLRDLESAKLYVDQVEMLENRTEGNLTFKEADLLRKSLALVRSHLVEALETSADDDETPVETATDA